MAEIQRKTYLEMDYFPAVGNFQSGSVPIDLCLIWQVSFSLSLLRNDQAKTHIKRQRAKQIMKCSIIGTQRGHLKLSFCSYSPCFWKCFLFFPSGLNRECYQIKVMYHSVIHRNTAGTHPQMPIPQLLSVRDMYPQAST